MHPFVLAVALAGGPTDVAWLRDLPGVQAEVLVSCPLPKCRIIHLADLRWMPRSAFIQTLPTHACLSEESIDDAYERYLKRVERVQLEQKDVLAFLAQHGLRRVLVEGLTVDRMDDFQLVLSLIEDLPDHDPRRRQLVLRFGAAARLTLSREAAVHPLDATELLEAGDAEAVTEDRVRKAIAAGGTVVLILDGSSDLSESVRRLGDGRVELVKVTPRAWRPRPEDSYRR